MGKNTKNAKKLAIEARKWISTTEGKRVLREAMHGAKEAVQQVRKARIISPEIMRRQITI